MNVLYLLLGLIVWSLILAFAGIFLGIRYKTRIFRTMQDVQYPAEKLREMKYTQSPAPANAGRDIVEDEVDTMAKKESVEPEFPFDADVKPKITKPSPIRKKVVSPFEMASVEDEKEAEPVSVSDDEEGDEIRRMEVKLARLKMDKAKDIKGSIDIGVIFMDKRTLEASDIEVIRKKMNDVLYKNKDELMKQFRKLRIQVEIKVMVR